MINSDQKVISEKVSDLIKPLINKKVQFSSSKINMGKDGKDNLFNKDDYWNLKYLGSQLSNIEYAHC